MTDQPWSLWAQLTINLLSVAFFISLWANLQFWFAAAIRPVRHLLFGLVMGLGAITSMLLSIQLYPGVMFDLRAALIAIASFFGGPASGLLATVISAAFRGWAGGPGMLVGLSNIVLAGCLGTLGYLAVGKNIRARHIVMLSIGTGAVWFLSLVALPSSYLSPSLVPLVVPVIVLTVIATIMAGLTVLQTKRAADERVLLRAAIAQSPDFQFVKNERSEFVAVNREVAAYNGFDRPEHMIGLTDFDLTSADRAVQLFEAEQRIVTTGQALLDFEERLNERAGERWFSTSKVPVRNEDGRMIGIAGVTRDITQRRKLEQDLLDSRDLLNFAVSEMADGLAMFDGHGNLTFCNERYRTLFPRTAHLRQPGVHIRDIMREVVRTGEQANASGLAAEEWIELVASSLATGGDEQVSLFDGRWLHLRTRATPSGAAMVLVSDFTEIKRSEEQAISMAGELKKLAATDSLTGLLNRRSFDAQLELAFEDSREGSSELSLLMIDVDNFKLYNDTYGHIRGDECLKQIAACLLGAVRGRDLVARYGGEEFAVILPNTSARAARETADRIRHEISTIAIPHESSPFGIVTASVGVATYTASSADMSDATDLLLVADRALYTAKANGRNSTHPRMA